MGYIFTAFLHEVDGYQECALNTDKVINLKSDTVIMENGFQYKINKNVLLKIKRGFKNEKIC